MSKHETAGYAGEENFSSPEGVAPEALTIPLYKSEIESDSDEAKLRELCVTHYPNLIGIFDRDAMVIAKKFREKLVIMAKMPGAGLVNFEVQMKNTLDICSKEQIRIRAHQEYVVLVESQNFTPVTFAEFIRIPSRVTQQRSPLDSWNRLQANKIKLNSKLQQGSKTWVVRAITADLVVQLENMADSRDKKSVAHIDSYTVIE